MSRNQRYSLYIAILLTPFALLLHLHSHLQMELYQLTHDIRLEDEQLLPTSDGLASASLNYRTAATDMLWLGGIFYASERRQMRQPRRGITEYADRIIDLDPHFHPIYYHHYSFRYELAVNPDVDDLEAANRILSIGLEHFPEDWRLARSMVLNHIGQRFARTDEERIADLEQALHYAQLGADAPDAPAEMFGLVISVRNRLDQLREQYKTGKAQATQYKATPEEIEFFLRRFFAADNDQQRQFIRHQLTQMGAEEDLVERINRHERELRDAHRENYSYLSTDTFSLIDTSLYAWHDSSE